VVVVIDVVNVVVVGLMDTFVVDVIIELRIPRTSLSISSTDFFALNDF
jgi:hypothetical protein